MFLSLSLLVYVSTGRRVQHSIERAQISVDVDGQRQEEGRLAAFNNRPLRQFLLALSPATSLIPNAHHQQIGITTRQHRFGSPSPLMSNKGDGQATATLERPGSSPGFMDRMGAAALATSAVAEAASAVSMRPLEAPELGKSYIAFNDELNANRTGVVDEVGLPLVYDKELIESYWKTQGSALTQRWTEFLGYVVPFLTKVLGYVITGGTEELQKHDKELARSARKSMEELGPTYIKLGQMMSVRPDVLPDGALDELRILQDSVKPFDTVTAIQQIETELGGPLGAFFSEISTEPVAAASLAQVYKAKLASTGEYVAVKIQRPAVLEVVSKDLYVLRRAAEVYQGLMERFAPQQRTNYVSLLNEFAVGFYTELDFLNEAANQMKLKRQLQEQNVTGVYIPKVYEELCSRRVLVSEWINGEKLSESSPEEISRLIPIAQEAFLVQLLQTGFFHADPHPGNIMKLSDEDAAEKKAPIALIDFGLIASVAQEDMDSMVSSIIHLANRDYASLVDDFINLNVLPSDCDRSIVIPLMDKALTPYVKGGGAKKYEAEIRRQYGLDEKNMESTVGGFQAMTQDALTVLNDVPFAIPPYFALLGRAIVTLEGIALTGDPDYGIIREAYPFVSRKLLSEDRPVMQKALQEILYGSEWMGPDDKHRVGGLQGARLVVLLNSALGVVAKNSDSVIDLDALPEDSVSISKALKFVLSPSAQPLRDLIGEEIVSAADILLRQSFRKSFELLSAQIESNNPLSVLARLPGLNQILPKTSFVDVPVPLLLPERSSPLFISLRDLTEAATPRLTREEELYQIALVDAIGQTLGKDAATVVSGDIVSEPSAGIRLLFSVISPQGENGAIDDLLKTAGFDGVTNGIASGLGLADTPLKSAIPIIGSVLPNVNHAIRSSGLAHNFIGEADAASGDVDTSEVVNAVADLDTEEAANLERFVDKVVGRVRNKVVDRLVQLS
mmetsp:Transcript_8059/g.12834  ORF Transcript_8059/g.12834 Transcript_8059/m.12834 type:complete len:960 (-) Transcript_8059:39-2918(-)